MFLKIFLLVYLVVEIYSDKSIEKPLIGIKPSKKIVGGQNAHPGHFPYLVSIQNRVAQAEGYTDEHRCGGVIIDKRWILTAAHCYKPGVVLLIKAGKYDISKKENHVQVVIVKSFIPSKDYHNGGKHNDIALIHLHAALKFNEHVANIHLPAEDSEPSGRGTLPGWGSLSPKTGSPMSSILQATTMTIIDRETCDKQITKTDHEDTIINSQICVIGPPQGGVGGCTGDSGSPLVMEKHGGHKEVVGIFSWTHDPCGEKDKPDVFTKVSAYIHWIKSVMDRHKHD